MVHGCSFLAILEKGGWVACVVQNNYFMACADGLVYLVSAAAPPSFILWISISFNHSATLWTLYPLQRALLPSSLLQNQ